jgi:chitin disaccharide deacetylase
MRYLIVNADDFGACSGVNRGIVEAFRHGIVTSTSLMVDRPGRDEAVALAGGCPDLGVGLHATVDDVMDAAGCRAALEAQLDRFLELLGRLPTHLDSHHHIHARPELLPAFRAVADGLEIPLRDYSSVRWCRRYYGQWSGESHPEHVSARSLVDIIERDTGDDVTELSCHPGRVDPELASSYAAEREHEVRALCDATVRGFLEAAGIALIHFGHLAVRRGGHSGAGA